MPTWPKADTTPQRIAFPLILAIILLLFPLLSSAGELTITPRERHITTQGAGIITLRFEVKNRSSQAQEFQETLDLPAGWRSVTTLSPFVLSEGVRNIRLIHIIIPHGTEAQTYDIRYAVFANRDPSINGSETINVRVKGKLGVSLQLLSPLQSLLEGESYELEFQLKNKGNKATRYNISVEDEDNFVTELKPQKLTIASGGTGSIIVTGKIPDKIGRTGTHSISLLAKKGKVTAKKTVDIPIISRTPQGIGKHHKLLGDVTIAYGVKDTATNASKLQLQYKAKGTFDEQGEHHIRIKARTDGGGVAGNTLNGRSEYKASYWNDDWRIHAGHHSFNPGRLAGESLFGTGAEVRYSPSFENGRKPFTVRFFEGESRSFAEKKAKATGIVGNFRFNGGISVGASQYAYQNENAETETINTISAAISKRYFSFKTTQGKDNNANSAESYDLSLRMGGLGANFSGLNSDPDFDGGESDTKQIFEGLHYQVNDRASVSVTGRKVRNNLLNDDSEEIREDKGHQLRVSHILGDAFQDELVFGYRQAEEKDLRKPSTVDRTIKALTAEYRRSLEDIDLRAALESGQREDRIEDSATGNKLDFSASWRRSRKLNLNMDFSVDKNLDAGGVQSQLGLSGSYKKSRKVTLTGYWNKTIRHSSNRSHVDSFQLAYRRKFDNQGTLSLIARETFVTARRDINKTDFTLLAEYSIPLDIKLHKRKNIGSFWAKLYYPETKKPVPNVVVQLDGQYAVSDDKGVVTYPELVARQYQLRLDTTRKGKEGFLLGHERPDVTINVTANETKTMNLPVRLGASIKGRLLKFISDTQASIGNKTKGNSPLVASDGIGKVLFELRPLGDVGNRTVQKRLSFGDGSFNFYGIAPGEWQLTVKEDRYIPEHFRLEEKSFTFTLGTGDTKELQIRAVPINQTIKKIGPAGGFNVSG